MILIPTISLGVSILGLSVLFYVKHWEETHARVFVPDLRLAADEKALEFKALLIQGKEEARKLGPTSLRLSRMLLHDLALSLAALSRASERGAHKLADMVSHKHAFQRRETQNEFLKQVSDVPMRNSREVVATIVAPEVTMQDEVVVPPPPEAPVAPVMPPVQVSAPMTPARVVKKTRRIKKTKDTLSR
jgi:hypothetical protein